MWKQDFGDGCSSSSDSDTEHYRGRPLKKAKYPWQVKGKHHLKSKKNPHKSSQFHNKSKSNGKCGSYTPHRTTQDLINSTAEPVTLRAVPMPLSLVTEEDENNYLKRWQTSHVARGYMDNTINSVLEKWVEAGLPFDSSSMLEYCEDDGQVEDEGILMAIEAHGLRKDQPPKGISKLTKNGGNLRKKSPSEPENATFGDLVYQVDVVNAAILFAIDKKGLSSSNPI